MTPSLPPRPKKSANDGDREDTMGDGEASKSGKQGKGRFPGEWVARAIE